jgi:hypothetical protein
MITDNKQRGLVKLIVIVIIGILILSYFRFDIRRLVEDKLTQENLAYVWGWIKLGWSYVWTFIQQVQQSLTNR